MILNEEKEATAKAVCLFVAEQIENKNIDIKTAAQLMSLLVSGIQEAKNTDDLQKLPSRVKQFSPSLPALILGL